MMSMPRRSAAVGTAVESERREAVRLAQRLVELELPRLVAFEVDVTIFRDLRFQSPVAHVVRGLLGERLRRSCLTGAPDCRGCNVRVECPYDRLFGSDDERGQRRSGFADVQPFWLQGLPIAYEVPVGATWTARLTAAGLDDADLQFLHMTWRRALEALGRGTAAALAPRVSPSRGYEIDLDVEPIAAETWWIEARTPLVLSPPQHSSHVASCPQAPWLPVLLAAGMRRLEALAVSTGGEEGRIPVVQPNLQAVEVLAGGFERWRGEVLSRRQGAIPIRDAYTGRAMLRLPGLPEVATLLERLAATGVGKKTTMGFGDLRVEPVR